MVFNEPAEAGWGCDLLNQHVQGGRKGDGGQGGGLEGSVQALLRTLGLFQQQYREVIERFHSGSCLLGRWDPGYSRGLEPGSENMPSPGWWVSCERLAAGHPALFCRSPPPWALTSQKQQSGPGEKGRTDWGATFKKGRRKTF